MRASNNPKSSSAAMVEFDDISAVDPLPPSSVAQRPRAPALDDTVEIELTAEQMDELLSGR